MDHTDESETAAPAEPADPNVTLKGRKHRLTPPHSYAERLDVRRAAGANWYRGCAAALVSCLPEPARRELGCSLAKSAYDLMQYGGACLDALNAKGIPLDEILDAGATALRLCHDVDADEVAALAKKS